MKKSTMEMINNVTAFAIMAGSVIYGFKEGQCKSKATKKARHPRNQKLAKLGDYYVTKLDKTSKDENYLELRRRTYDAECCDNTLALKLSDEQLIILKEAKHMCVNAEPTVFTCKGGYIHEWFGTTSNEIVEKKHVDRNSGIEAQVSVMSASDFALITISYFEKDEDGDKNFLQNFAIKLDYGHDESEFRGLVDRMSLV